MGRLEGKTAIITGASQGTGEVIARLFAEEGARVLLGDIRDERGLEIAREVGDSGSPLLSSGGCARVPAAKVGRDDGNLENLYL